MACCVPYQMNAGDGPVAHAWWASPADWVRDAYGVGTPCEVFNSASAALLSAGRKFGAFLSIFARNPSLFAFYFFLGLAGTIPMLTMQFLLKDTFQLEPESMKVWGTCVVLPWGMKLAFAFSSDRWAVCGYHRKAYILLGSLVGSVGWFGAGLMVIRRRVVGADSIVDSELAAGSFASFTTFVVCVNLGIAWADACVNAALMDYIAKTDDAPGVQSVKASTQSIGSLIGVLAGSWALTAIDPEVVVLSMAGITLAMFLCGCLIPEERLGPDHDRRLAAQSKFTRGILADVDRSHSNEAGSSSGDSRASGDREAGAAEEGDKSLGEHLLDVWALLHTPSVFRVLVFLAAATLPPDSGTAMFYFLTESLHLSRGFISLVTIVSAACSIFGTFLYFAKLQALSFRTLFLSIFLVCAPLGFLQIALVQRTNVAVGIPDTAFILGDDVLQAITVSIIQTPILVIISDACPTNLKGTAYELVNSVANLCAIASSFLSAGLMDSLGISRTNFHNLTLLLVITNTLNMLPLALTWCLPDRRRPDPRSRTISPDSQQHARIAHTSDGRAVQRGILLSASLAQPENRLWSLLEQDRFVKDQLRRNTRIVLRANVDPPATASWELRQAVPAASRERRAPFRPRLQPLQPGQVVPKAATGSYYRYAAVRGRGVHNINALRAIGSARGGSGWGADVGIGVDPVWGAGAT